MADVIRFTDPDTEQELEIPAKYEVCDRCEGRGAHVDPAIDGNGLSREDFDGDPDFKESYFSGHYDVRCRDCDGKRVELHPDWAKMTPEQREAYERYSQGERDWRAASRAEMMAERRMGA